MSFKGREAFKLKSQLFCFICRKKFAEVYLNCEKVFPKLFDFCPMCEKKLMEGFEAQFRKKLLKFNVEDG